MTETPIIKKLQTIFKLGYVPSRGNESYAFKVAPFFTSGKLCNCLSHACFNLKNSHYIDYNIDEYDILTIQGHLCEKKKITKTGIKTKIGNLLKQTGLEITKFNPGECLKSNQWKVALFFDEIDIGVNHFIRDFHFMLEERDKTWSSKIHFSDQVENLNQLPTDYKDYYKLDSIYKITNPHAKIYQEEPKIISEFNEKTH